MSEVLRLAFYAGVAYRHDAVSNSFMEKLHLVDRLAAEGYPIEAVGFTTGTDYDHAAIQLASRVREVMEHPAFAGCDAHIFERAMPYPLFDVIALMDRPILMIDHNTTPVDLVADEQSRAACQQAHDERIKLELAAHIATVGEFTRYELIDLGFDGDNISVLHLPPAVVAADAFDRTTPHTPLRLLYVGRMVEAKGVLDLLEAMESCWSRPITLTMAGSLRFPEARTLERIEEVARMHPGQLHLHFDAGDDEVADLYRNADVVVIPSHHEGYCVPVVEALGAGCYVIASSAGNLPFVMGGLGTIVPPGDPEALGRAISDVADALGRGDHPTSWGPLDRAGWQEKVKVHLASYTKEHYEASLLGLIHQILEEPPAWLTEKVTSG